MKKLLIVCYKFPPINTMGSRRWSEMISVLREKFDITVFTTNSTGDLITDHPEDKIYRFGNIRNRLFDTEKQKIGLAHKLIRTFTYNLRTIDSTFISWFMKYRKEFLKLLKEIKPDIVITSTVSIAPAMFGYLAKKNKPDIYWINDLRDSMSLFNEEEKNLIQRKVDRFIDKHVISKADMIFTVSNTLKNLFREFYQRPVHTIFNGFEADVVKFPQKYNEIPLLYYAGRIYPHREQALYMLLKAVKDKFLEFKIRLVGEKEQFLKYTRFLKKNVIKNVSILNPVDHETVRMEEAQADLLVLFEDLDQSKLVSKGTLSGKLFEYLPQNGYILAICRPDSEIGEILKKTGRGKIESTLSGIDTFLQEHDFTKLEDPQIDRIKFYSRQYQAHLIISYLEELFSGSYLAKGHDR